MAEQALCSVTDSDSDSIAPVKAKPVADSTSRQMTDLLVRVGQHQDKVAFASLFTHFAPRVKAYMFRLGCEDSEAEELAQQVMVKVWHKANLFDASKAAASTWIFRVARNLRTDMLRKQRFISADDEWLGQIEDESDSPETSVDRGQQVLAMRKALDTLPPDQLTVIQLSFYEGLSHGDIAERLGLPPGTVKSRMRLAYEKLRASAGELL